MRNIPKFFLFVAASAPLFAHAQNLFISFSSSGNIGLYNGTTGAAINPNFASVEFPAGAAVGPDGNLYVSTSSANLPSESGAAILSFGINGSTSTAKGVFAGHSGPSGNNNLNNPQGIAFFGGNMYVADATGGFVFEYNSSGALINTLSGGINAPIGITFDSSGTLYASDLNSGDVFKYNGTTFVPVNSTEGIFNGTRNVAVSGNSLFALDASGTGGIYKINLSDGSATKIVDYSASPFEATDLTLGPDGNLYVSGTDGNTDDGEVLEYGLDGSGGNQVVDTGIGSGPTSLTFGVIPEPSTLSLAGLAAAAFAFAKAKKLRR